MFCSKHHQEIPLIMRYRRQGICSASAHIQSESEIAIRHAIRKVKVKRLILIIVLVACIGSAWVADAEQCENEDLKSVTSDGEILVMLSGSVYRVLAGDTIDSALWLPPADVIICQRTINVQGRLATYYEIINLDEKEKVGATRLR
jgi:hypothetical protein